VTFQAFRDNELVPVQIYDGSMGTNYRPVLIRYHAVEEAPDGSLADRTLCGARYSRRRQCRPAQELQAPP